VISARVATRLFAKRPLVFDDYFSTPNTKKSNYLDLMFTHDLGRGFGLVAHYGSFKFNNVNDGDSTTGR
jgi:hypothetical protein